MTQEFNTDEERLAAIQKSFTRKSSIKETFVDRISKRRMEMEINGKTAYIANVLGDQIEGIEGGCKTIIWRFENKRFWIEDYNIECNSIDGVMGGFRRREIKYDGKRVFYMAGGGEKSFIPGEWEEEFNRLYLRA